MDGESSRIGPATLPRIGDVLCIRASDYCYGSDPLTLRVTGVTAEASLPPGLEWLSLRGVEVNHDGTQGAERHVLVRISALPTTP